MDWNKTKTIFIVVFSILNVFLYSLYFSRHMEVQSVQVMAKTSIEESLKLDNITVSSLPVTKSDSSYVSAKIVEFDEEDISKLKNQSAVILNETQLQSVIETPVNVQSAKGEYHFTEFLSEYVLHGEEYGLWEVDEEKRKAYFFQKVNGEPIYFSSNAMLVVYWNSEGKVTSYEQRMFGDFVSYNRKQDLLSPLEAIGLLSSRGFLKQDSHVEIVEPGYSTLVQLTKTQVFAPTWHVRVQLKDKTIEDYFINAIEGKITEFQLGSLEEVNLTQQESLAATSSGIDARK